MDAFEARRPTRIAVCGDWHGNTEFAKRAIEYAAEAGAQVVLHVGDFGYDFTPRFMSGVQSALSNNAMLLGFVPGNHENYAYLDRQVLKAPEGDHPAAGAIPLRPNLFYLKRGYRWMWHGVRFLGLGGAHSVDRPWRTPGMEWWPQERITYDDARSAMAGGEADVMICHDVPAGVHIPAIDGNPLGFPQAEIDTAEQHRELLRSVVDVVRPRRLFAGHYHCRLTDELHDPLLGYRTTVDILADDQPPMSANCGVFDIADLSA